MSQRENREKQKKEDIIYISLPLSSSELENFIVTTKVLNQHEFFVSWFYRAEAWNQCHWAQVKASAWLIPSGATEGRISCLFQLPLAICIPLFVSLLFILKGNHSCPCIIIFLSLLIWLLCPPHKGHRPIQIIHDNLKGL